MFGGFAVLAALGVHLGLDELWEAIGRADPSRLAAFLALSITVFVLYATRWRLVLRTIDATPPPPLPTLVARKYWPPVGRADNAYGDRNLFCSCVPIADYE